MPHKQSRSSAKAMADMLIEDSLVLEARELGKELSEVTNRVVYLRKRRRELIEELHEQRYTWAVIAALLDISVQRVYQISGRDRRATPYEMQGVSSSDAMKQM